jgi:hypothetical protein
MIPLYWSIQNALRKNPKEIERITELMGGISVGHTSPQWAIEAAMATGKPVLLVITMHVNEVRFLSETRKHQDDMFLRRALGLKPAQIILHYEGPQMPQDLIYCWHKAIKEVWDVPLGYYKWPGWDMTAFGADHDREYKDQTVPADFTCFNIYHEDAAAINRVMVENRTHKIAEYSMYPILPVLSHQGFYYSEHPNWGWQRFTSRRPQAWINIGRILKRDKPLGVWMYNSFYDGRVNNVYLEQSINYLKEGINYEG